MSLGPMFKCLRSCSLKTQLLFFSCVYALSGCAAPNDMLSVEAGSASDLVIVNARIARFDRPLDDQDTLYHIAINDETISEVSTDKQLILGTANQSTRLIDAQGKRVIPGLIDTHTHVVRGGRFYNLETRWEDVTSIREAMSLIRTQAERTPKGQWVRVIGGWSPYQFEEARMPTLAEINEAAPNTPVFILFLYSGGMLNEAGLRALNIDENSKAPQGSRYERDADGKPTGRLIAEPNPMILYQTIGALPGLSQADQYNSSIQFYRKLLSLGMTSAIDAGGGGHDFPDDYSATQRLASEGKLPMRVSAYLFPQEPDKEFNQFRKWMGNHSIDANHHLTLQNGYTIEGGGELLVWSASDFENFTAQRPDLAEHAEQDLHKVITLHVKKRWPFRIHATYDESITRVLNTLEKVNRKTPFDGLQWILDHAETISDENIDRVKQLGGGIAVQNRMAYAGEYFVERYGHELASRAPPLKRILAAGVPLGLGTDGTRVSSFNPWISYYWAVTGKTVGGLALKESDETLDRITALRLLSKDASWFSNEKGKKGDIKAGMLADLAILNQDIFTVEAEKLKKTESLLTIVGGKVEHAGTEYPRFMKDKLNATPSWSPVNLQN